MVVRDDDRASQILVLPARASPGTAHQARGLVDAIIAQDSNDGAQVPSSSRVIPWHIANRYYEADVHFRLADVPLQPDVAAVHSTRTRRLEPRTARLVGSTADGNNTSTSGAGVAEDDAVLAARTRNVFEALERGGATPSGTGQRNDQERSSEAAHRRALVQQFTGVQAVIMLVDREQSIEQHRALLALVAEEQQDLDSGDDEALSLLSGFDLAVSLVVALPSVAETATASLSSAAHGIEVLYAGEGWEYIDLAGDNEKLPSEGSGSEAASSASDDGPVEAEGVDRIREALMAHTWPGLRQASDRRKQRIVTDGGILSVQTNVSSGPSDVADALSNVRLHMDEADNAADAVKPTARDEELAKAFLARIQASATDLENGSSNGADAHAHTQKDMQAALERFLEDEDESWPQARGQTASSPSRKDEKWPQSAHHRSTSASQSATVPTTFDDDFTDFVAQPVHNSTTITPSDDDLFAEDQWSQPFDQFTQSGIGDADDELLMRALAKDENTRRDEHNSDVHVDFEATLSAVMAHAERVRAIPDHDTRRQEAARVALALLDRP